MNKNEKDAAHLQLKAELKTNYREHSIPIFATSGFDYESAEHAKALFSGEAPGDIYSRLSNPNNTEFIRLMAKFESAADGVAVASGMAAIFAVMASLLSSGDHIIVSKALFGSTHQVVTQILPRWNIEVSMLAPEAFEDLEPKLRSNTRLIFLETPSNPGLDIIDIQNVCIQAAKKNIPVAVDNTFATPILQKPIESGAQIVVHSATKFIDGQGRTIAGAVLGNIEIIQRIKDFTIMTGPTLSPFDSWILSKSLETFQLRMEKHCTNAEQLAFFFNNHPEVESVQYPFLDHFKYQSVARKQMAMGGAMINVSLKGDQDRAFRFLNHLKTIKITANLGDNKTLITHPATTTHSKLSKEERKDVGITDRMMRISAGLENIDDLIAEVNEAIELSR